MHIVGIVLQTDGTCLAVAGNTYGIGFDRCFQIKA